MSLRIKNWEDFQHFKDRTPPWIKLYRYLLDDPEWHELDGESCKVLVMLWLIASEDKAMDGNLPNTKTLCFRLRISETQLNQSVSKLSHWLYLDDIEVISECHQDDAPEERQRRDRGETKSKKSSISENFSISDRVKKWADSNGHSNLDAHLANFVLVCKAKNYQYVDWDAAFMTAISKNWADVKKPANDKPAYQRNVT